MFNKKTLDRGDAIAIYWHIDDVKSIADVTDEQAREVLRIVKRRHDASVGIDWNTLRIVADEVKENEVKLDAYDIKLIPKGDK